nr:xylulose kinase-1 [Tanacetum cinerariifolium]
MKMEYWIMNTDHNLWKIIQNGNSKKSLGRDSKGGIIILPPVSFEEHVTVSRETKARTLLLHSLPEDHMVDFHHLDDAKEIWLAVKARFGGNEESKKMRKTMLKQALSDFSVSEEKGLHKGYDSTTVAPTHSAFIGAASTNTKMVYSDQPSYSSLISYTHVPSGSIMEVDQLEMEELDIKWQMAMLSLRINKFQKKAGMKINFNNEDSARFDRRKARCYNYLQLGHFAIECNVKKVDERARYSAFKISENEEAEQVYGLMAEFESDFAVPASNAAGGVNPNAVEFAMMGNSPKAKLEKNEWEIKFVDSLARFDKWKESSKNLAKLLYSSMSTRLKLGLGFKEYIGSDEVCYLSTPNVFDPEPDNREVKSLYESDKSSASKTYDFASYVSSPKTNDSFSTIDSWLVQEQTALGKDKSIPLTVGSLLKTTWSSIHHLLTDEVLTSPEQTATDWMLVFHNPAVFGVPADLSYWSPYSCWFLVAAAVGCCWFGLFMLLE